MATGLKVPIGVTPKGGCAWVDGDANDVQQIKVALSDCDNEHAFQQDLGLGDFMIFDNSEDATRTKIEVRLRKIFQMFERRHRFKLVQKSVQWEDGDSDGELVLSFKYLNLESDEEKTFREVFTAGGE